MTSAVSALPHIKIERRAPKEVRYSKEFERIRRVLAEIDRREEGKTSEAKKPLGSRVIPRRVCRGPDQERKTSDTFVRTFESTAQSGIESGKKSETSKPQAPLAHDVERGSYVVIREKRERTEAESKKCSATPIASATRPPLTHEVVKDASVPSAVRHLLPPISLKPESHLARVVRARLGGIRSEVIDWGTHKAEMRKLFPNVLDILYRVKEMGSDHICHSIFTLRSRILESASGASLTLGKDILFYGLKEDDPEGRFARTIEERIFIEKWNRYLVSDDFNPQKIETVLSFGTRFEPKEAFTIPLTRVRHETFYIEDYFFSAAQAKENVLQLLSLTSGYPKDAFNCIVEAVPGIPPFPKTVFRIMPGSLHTHLSAEDLFRKPFLAIYETLSSNKGVFVHCQRGISRSATIVILWLMLTFKLSPSDAEVFVRSRRSFINPNPLWESLIREVYLKSILGKDESL